MRLEQLEYFVSAVSLQSLTDVSKVFYVSPQVVSKSIKQLEEELRIKLFIRSRKELLLTEQGKDVYYHAVEVVNQIKYLRDTYSMPIDEKQFIGVVTILAAKGMASFFHNLFKSAMPQKLPEMKLTLHTKNSYEIISNIENLRDTDMIGMIYPSNDWNDICIQKIKEEYEVYLLKKEKLKVFMNRNAPFSQQKEISIKKLTNLPLLGYSLEQKTFFGAWLKDSYGVHLNYVMEVDNIALCLDLVEDGRGYALGLDTVFSDILSPEKKNKIVSVPLEVSYYYSYIILVDKKRLKEGNVKAFLDILACKFGTIIP